MGKYKKNKQNNNNTVSFTPKQLTKEELIDKYGETLGDINKGAEYLSKLHPHVPLALLQQQLKIFYIIDNMPKALKETWIKEIDNMPLIPKYDDFPSGLPDLTDSLIIEKSDIVEEPIITDYDLCLNCSL
jgi:hypothetical protein